MVNLNLCHWLTDLFTLFFFYAYSLSAGIINNCLPSPHIPVIYLGLFHIIINIPSASKWIWGREQQHQHLLSFARVTNSGPHPALNPKLQSLAVRVPEPSRGRWWSPNLRTSILDISGQFLTVWWGFPLSSSVSPFSLLPDGVEDVTPRPPFLVPTLQRHRANISDPTPTLSGPLSFTVGGIQAKFLSLMEERCCLKS